MRPLKKILWISLFWLYLCSCNKDVLVDEHFVGTWFWRGGYFNCTMKITIRSDETGSITNTANSDECFNRDYANKTGKVYIRNGKLNVVDTRFIIMSKPYKTGNKISGYDEWKMTLKTTPLLGLGAETFDMTRY